MQIVFHVLWQIKVDDDGHVLHVDTSGQQISGDENTRRAVAELLDNGLSALGEDGAVSGADGEVTLLHLLCEPVDLRQRVRRERRKEKEKRKREVEIEITFEITFRRVLQNITDEVILISLYKSHSVSSFHSSRSTAI